MSDSLDLVVTLRDITDRETSPEGVGFCAYDTTSDGIELCIEVMLSHEAIKQLYLSSIGK